LLYDFQRFIQGGVEGTVIWIVLSIGMLALPLVAVIHVSEHEDRAARRIEKEHDPFSDVEITITGRSSVVAPRVGPTTDAWERARC
jgi:hypothetical protein